MKPTPTELYEQAKTLLRHALLQTGVLTEGGSPFVLACHDCGLAFRADIELGMVADHARTHGHDPDKDGLHLDLVWVNPGPPPESRKGAS